MLFFSKVKKFIDSQRNAYAGHVTDDTSATVGIWSNALGTFDGSSRVPLTDANTQGGADRPPLESVDVALETSQGTICRYSTF